MKSTLYNPVHNEMLNETENNWKIIIREPILEALKHTKFSKNGN